jgi:hypothetical protein
MIMQHKNKKLIFSILTLLFTVSICTSCIGDLDVDPIDPNVNQTFQQDGVFAKIYAGLALTGQEGPAGQGDLDGIDEGFSCFVRLTWNLNTLPTDEAICSWNDNGIPELNSVQWGSANSQINGAFARYYFNITLCNHFLEKTDGMTDEKTRRQRAEVRFIRALNWFYLMDLFGDVVFLDRVTADLPERILRADLFNYIIQELTEAEADMFEPRQAPYYRADKAANWLLKSRVLLNAEVYIGTARWLEAAQYSKRVMDSAYQLTAVYEHLFMADNNGSSVNRAPEEIILPLAAFGQRTRSFGSSLFLIASTHVVGMPDWGTPTEGWAGNRARESLVNKFFPGGNIPDNAFLSPNTTGAADRRALFFIHFETDDDNDDPDRRPEQINRPSIFKEGLSVRKFRNIRADGGVTSDSRFVDMDVPFLRAAEANLTFAEATLRNNGSLSDALAAVNVIRIRANAPIFTTLTLDMILDEKAREFYFEGQRRTDLIRFGRFGGSDYNWDWKGGVQQGTRFNVNYNRFPIPASALNANENLIQNPGY